MRETSTFTVSLPPAMAKQIEKVMKTEHRTRSELVREALRVYFTVRAIPTERLTAAEARAYRRGMAAYKRGDYVTLGDYVRRREQLRLLEAFGTFDFDSTH
ncbi:MAG: ribbon-helix-helix domain-containing protein, partial [Terriglobales bacterium]